MLTWMLFGWFALGVLSVPFAYARFRAQHARDYPLSERAGRGGGYALTQATTGILMGGLSVPMSILQTRGSGWDWRA